MNEAELAANTLNAGSIVLAGRNSVHTWWTGIAGCVLFGWVFLQARLYADVTLQVFFVITSALGWWSWLHGAERQALPVTSTRRRTLAALTAVGAVAALGYGLLLRRFTDAFAPIPDSIVLAFSVVAQLLLMRRRVESWWFWLLVNSVAVPLYLARGLYVTALLYAAFWLNALVSLRYWRRQAASG